MNKLFHPEKGVLTPAGKKYKSIGNRISDVYLDEQGNELELDGTERPYEAQQNDNRKELVNQIIEQNQKEKQKLSDEMDFEQNLEEHDKKEAETEEKSIRHRELLESQKNSSEEIIQAIKEIPETVIPEIPDHSKEYKKWKDEIVKAVRGIKIPETKLAPVIKAINSIKFPDIPKTEIPKPIDYKPILEEIRKALPKDTDIAPIVEAVKAIPQFEIPSELIRNGRIKVEVDRASTGGGGGGHEYQTYDSVEVDTTNDPIFTITRKKGGSIVDVKTITVI